MHSEDEKIDARDQRDGGWSWVQNDLYTFFLPIIGREATHLYQVMTYLIPTRANNPVFDLSLRVIGQNAMMGKTTVSKYLGVLERVGMIVEQPGGTEERPMLVLGDLRKLAKLGEKEIRRRIGVRVADSDDEGGGPDSTPEGGDGGPQGGPGSGDAPQNGSRPGQMEAASPEGSGEEGVRVADSGADLGPASENLRETTLVNLVLSAKQGGTVREKGGNCPRKGYVVSAKDDPFKVLNLSREETTTPLPPEIGGREISLIATDAEATRNGENQNETQSKNFPSEGQEQNGGERAAQIAAELAASPGVRLAGQLVWASARVMWAHSFTPNPRIEEAISEAFELWCSKTRRTPDEAVSVEAENFRAYQAQSSLMSYGWGWRWWFKQGNWAKPELWPYDRQKLAQMRHANIGANPYPRADQEGGP